MIISLIILVTYFAIGWYFAKNHTRACKYRWKWEDEALPVIFGVSLFVWPIILTGRIVMAIGGWIRDGFQSAVQDI